MQSGQVPIATVVVDRLTPEDLRAALRAEINAALERGGHDFRIEPDDISVQPGAPMGGRLTVKVLLVAATLGAAQEAGKDAYYAVRDAVQQGVAQVADREGVVESEVHEETFRDPPSAAGTPRAPSDPSEGR